MNVVFIASLKSYTTSVSLINAFRHLGHEVRVLSDVSSIYVEDTVIVAGDFSIAEYIVCNNLEPDLVFFCEGGSMKLFPRGLGELRCLSAWYAIDSHMDLAKHLQIAQLFDVTFTAQKEYVSKFLEKGIQQCYWLPLAFDSFFVPVKDVEKVYDISYVGTMDFRFHKEREPLIKSLQAAFPKSFFGRAKANKMYEIYAQSQLVFNRSINNDLNMRFFEAIGSGAVLLTNKLYKNGLEDIFQEGVHYIIYEKDSVVEVAKHFLEKGVDRSEENIAYVKQNHLYLNRAGEIQAVTWKSKKVAKSGDEAHYLKIYMLLESYNAVMGSLVRILGVISQGSAKKKLLFLPLLFVASVTEKLLKIINR